MLRHLPKTGYLISLFTAGEMSPLEDELCGLSCEQFEADGAACTPNQGDTCTPSIVPIEYTNGTRDNLLLETECNIFRNPEEGNSGFDNFGMSTLTIFVTLTLEGWVEVYYDLNAGFGLDYVNALFFIIVIVCLPFVILNLTLAVVWDEYSKADAIQKQQALELAQEIFGEESGNNADNSFTESPKNTSPKDRNNHPVESTAKDVLADTPHRPDRNSRWNWLLERNIVWRQKVKRIVSTSKFEKIMGLFIVLNTLALAVEHFGMPRWLDVAQDWVNFACTIVFILEMVFKLYGLGWREYVADKFNIFDGTVVFASVIEVLLEFTVGGAVPGISVLRTFRIFRTFKVARSWKALDKLLKAIVRSVAGVTYASFLLFIFMFVYVLLGMQIFGGGWPEGERPRPHFDNLWWAIVTTFQVLSTEDWDDVLYDYIPQFGVTATVLYTVSLIILGNYIIMNLFLAILLSNFEEGDEEEDSKTSDGLNGEEPQSSDPPPVSNETTPADNDKQDQTKDLAVDDDGCRSDEERKSTADVIEKQIPKLETGEKCTEMQRTDMDANNQGTPRLHLRYKAANRPMLEATLNTTGGKQERLKISHRGDVVTRSALEFGNPEAFDLDEAYGEGPYTRWQHSFFLFSPDNVIRRWCSWIISQKAFERFLLLVIIYSSVLLAVEEPDVRECRLSEDDEDACPTLARFLRVSEIIIVVIFSAEMVLKSIARGVIIEKHAYLRNGWDFIDFFVVVISIVTVAVASDSDSLRSLRALRSVRALRPLRVIRRFFGMRLVINAVIGSIPRVTSVVIINILFMLIFAVVGVQQWMGSLYRCNDGEIKVEEECTGTFMLQNDECFDLPTEEEIRECRLKVDGVEFERVWEPLEQNFDNVLNGILSVFEVATNELWPEIMFNTVDATEPGKALERDNNTAAALWFILVQLLFNFFMMEVFTGVVVDYYQGLRHEAEGGTLLTAEQARWVKSVKEMATSAPKKAMKRPKGKCERLRVSCYLVASNYYFDMFIMTCIALNVLAMATRHYGMSRTWEDFAQYSNILFVSIFAAEALIKISGFGFRQYFSVRWNQFDFTLAVVGLAALGTRVGGLAAFFRLFRVLRLFRLVRGSSTLRQMFKTLLLSIPSVMNILAVVALMIFMYAVFGMNAFSSVRFGRTSEFHNEDANFRSFWVSAMTLVRTTTGEDWNGIMHDLMVRPPFCIDGENCGDRMSPPVYFCSFVLMVEYILMNLLIAVVLENFLATSIEADDDSKPFVLTQELLEEFQRGWAMFDPRARNKITKVHHVVALMINLPYPLGLFGHPGLDPERSAIVQARRLLLYMDIPLLNGGFTFHAVLQALVHNARSSYWKHSVLPPKGEKMLRRNSPFETVIARQGVTTSAKEAVALDVLSDMVYKWKYRVQKGKLEREWGRAPTDGELAKRGYSAPGILPVKYIRAIVIGAARRVHKEQQHGIRKHVNDADYVNVPVFSAGQLEEEVEAEYACERAPPTCYGDRNQKIVLPWTDGEETKHTRETYGQEERQQHSRPLSTLNYAEQSNVVTEEADSFPPNRLDGDDGLIPGTS